MDWYILLSKGSICVAVGYLLGVALNSPFPNNSIGQPLTPEHSHLSRLELLVTIAMICILVAMAMIYRPVHLVISLTPGYRPEVSSATHCTCAPERVRCEVHDMKLLLELSKNIRDELDITALCLELEISANVLPSYRKTDGLAVFNMLRENWYHKVDGLRTKSEGLRRLKHALTEIGKEAFNETIIQRCLDHA